MRVTRNSRHPERRAKCTLTDGTVLLAMIRSSLAVAPRAKTVGIHDPTMHRNDCAVDAPDESKSAYLCVHVVNHDAQLQKSESYCVCLVSVCVMVSRQKGERCTKINV